jgi:hypothetical protein
MVLQDFLFHPSKPAVNLDPIPDPRHVPDFRQWFASRVPLEESVHAFGGPLILSALFRIPIAILVAVSHPRPFTSSNAMRGAGSQCGGISSCPGQRVKR